MNFQWLNLIRFVLIRVLLANLQPFPVGFFNLRDLRRPLANLSPNFERGKVVFWTDEFSMARFDTLHVNEGLADPFTTFFSRDC